MSDEQLIDALIDVFEGNYFFTAVAVKVVNDSAGSVRFSNNPDDIRVIWNIGDIKLIKAELEKPEFIQELLEIFGFLDSAIHLFYFLLKPGESGLELVEARLKGRYKKWD